MCFHGETSQREQSVHRIDSEAFPFRVKNTFVDVAPPNTTTKDSQKIGGMRRLRSEPALNTRDASTESNKAPAAICLDDDDVAFDSDTEVWSRLVTGDSFDLPLSPSSDETTTQCSTGGPSEAEISSLVENTAQTQQGSSTRTLNFCPFCGGKVKAAFKFCSYCGGALPA
mmetsp:Transcript_16277/g.35257  ORF Transcript_16277/g.35257 Transcript_16277/m.35257 type:complete len:170 (-) Transcript_16277:350-859(-)|eukprot:CAMPEP_0206464612 /NCGR_PEP_ID=MMETSP0324_2-20121206/27321_1 /ASSEMBLY_ACC=CAM_ASM_000836 /TAXON_ID=2866 /ORGANISM="Crypthecodinium cohnii, Strain Seligo" /LENGTH=169 /DNA_ID=CAMNT_0053937279 /DNA_START=125 /DNA_END=634 /DNA_ORIENTATION=-